MPKYVYTEKEMSAFEKFVEEQFGHFESVLHEIVSPDIHLDVIVVPPNEKHNYYQLVTMGMGAYKMKIPQMFKILHLERAELVICLPPDWNVNSSKEEDYWPIRVLKSAARIPVSCNTWLGYGHTISNDEENTQYASNTGFCSVALLDTNGSGESFPHLDLSFFKKNINFYRLFPLYKEELENKLNSDNGIDELLETFEKRDLSCVIDIHRKNYGIQDNSEIPSE